jgi:hypothetical protein
MEKNRRFLSLFLDPCNKEERSLPLMYLRVDNIVGYSSSLEETMPS